MAAPLSLEALRELVAAGRIDTVIACMVDMQGRLIGKRFQAEFFIDGGHQETHCCNYLMANDIDMEPVPGYAAASWSQGYGDFVLKPDLATLRRIPWLEGTALVLCDVLDHHHQELPHSPRAILKRQLARLESRGYCAMFASELEFYLFDESYEAIHARNYQSPRTASLYPEDYHILQTTREEPVMRSIRRNLQAAGIAVENSKGEWGPGQEEINVRYADALTMADNHSIIKNACKEIALLQGKSVTFMAKWRYDEQPYPQFAVERRPRHPAVSRFRRRMRHVATDALVGRRTGEVRGRHHLFPGAVYQLVQTLPERHLRADAGHLEPRQSHRRFPPVRRGHARHPHRMPHRRRRPQSLSRVRRIDRGGAGRH
jgi:hypothetical protein